MPEGDKTRMGGTMRLGSRVTVLRPGSRAFALYGGAGAEGLEVGLHTIPWEFGRVAGASKATFGVSYRTYCVITTADAFLLGKLETGAVVCFLSLLHCPDLVRL